jgi:hypothetical protein
MQIYAAGTKSPSKKVLAVLLFQGLNSQHGGINCDPSCKGDAGELMFQGEVQG